MCSAGSPSSTTACTPLGTAKNILSKNHTSIIELEMASPAHQVAVFTQQLGKGSNRRQINAIDQNKSVKVPSAFHHSPGHCHQWGTSRPLTLCKSRGTSEKWMILRETAERFTYSILPLQDLLMRTKISFLQSRHWQGKKKAQENAAVWSPWMAESALWWQQHYQISQGNALVLCQSPPGITSRDFTSEPCWQFARQESWNAPVSSLWGEHRGQNPVCRRNSTEKGSPGKQAGLGTSRNITRLWIYMAQTDLHRIMARHICTHTAVPGCRRKCWFCYLLKVKFWER